MPAALPHRLLSAFRWSLFVGVATLLAAEGLLRLAAPLVFDDSWVQPNEPGVYRFHDATADVLPTFNRFGQRGLEVPLERTSGRRRVAFIGDSTTWGEGLEDDQTWPAQVGAALGIEALNVSRPGAGVYDYLDYWRRNASHFAPDTVVVGFFMGNDMFSALNPYALDAGPTLPDPPATGLRGAIERRRRAARAVTARVRTTPVDLTDVWFGPAGTRWQWSPLNPANLAARAAAEGVPPEEATARLSRVPAELRRAAEAFEVDPWLVSAAALHPASMAESQALERPSVLRAWDASLEVLGELLDDVRARGATPVVFMIPRAVQVDVRYHADFREVGFDVPETMATTDAPQRTLQRWCDQRGISWVDALPALRQAHAADPELRHWFRHDVHLNVAGNAALAQVVTAALRADAAAAGAVGQ